MVTVTRRTRGLTDEQVALYREQGFLRFDALICGSWLAHYKGILDDLVERSKSLQQEIPHFTLQLDAENRPMPGFLHKVQGVCVVEPRLLDLAKEHVILDKVETLLGPNMDIFGTKFFPLLPYGGTSTSWHQDNYYFGTKGDGTRPGEQEIVTCGIYLEDCTVENGCLRLIPKSHATGEIVRHYHRPGQYGTGHWADIDESQAVEIECPAGTVILFSANLLHAANHNRSDRSRYSTAWHYIRGDLDLESFQRGKYADRHTVRGV